MSSPALPLWPCRFLCLGPFCLGCRVIAFLGRGYSCFAIGSSDLEQQGWVVLALCLRADCFSEALGPPASGAGDTGIFYILSTPLWGNGRLFIKTHFPSEEPFPPVYLFLPMKPINFFLSLTLLAFKNTAESSVSVLMGFFKWFIHLWFFSAQVLIGFWKKMARISLHSVITNCVTLRWTSFPAVFFFFF